MARLVQQTRAALFGSGLLALLSLRPAAAHSCDQSGLQCMDVQLYSSSFSTDAEGVPLCTPEGTPVYCLINDDYHRCRVGQAACCPDGSQPSHSGYGQSQLLESCPQTATRSGQLQLIVNLNDGFSHSHLTWGQTPADVQLQLERHKGVISNTLAANLGFVKAQIKYVRLWTSSGRRLAKTAEIHIAFDVFDKTRPQRGDLTSDLQQALQKVNANVDIQSASMEWQADPTSDGRGEEDSHLLPLLLVSVAGAVACLVILGSVIVCWMRSRRRKASKAAAPPGVAKTPDEVVDLECVKEKEGKLQDDAEVSSTSTGAPASDDMSVEGAFPEEGVKSPSMENRPSAGEAAHIASI